jgi:hypothetical protein
MHHDLNPPHDTRHDTRLPVLTEVDGSMNPLAELDDTTRTRKFGVKPVCYENVQLQLHTSRVHIYTCLNMTPGGLRAQYLIPNLMPKCECLSIHSSLPFEPRHHATPRNLRKQSFCRTETNCRPQASPPNLLKKSSPVERDLSSSQAHKSVPLMYQFLVLTYAPSITG